MRKHAKNLALAFATFLLCFVALEVVLRVAGYGNVEIYEPDPRFYWKNKANQHAYTTVNHKRFNTNSKGTRGPEFAVEKPANTVRILTLGDSRTFGWGLGDDETFSAVLEKKLQAQFGNSKRIEVINAGVNSWSYAQMFVYLRELGVTYHPDFVVVGEPNLWTQFNDKQSPEFVKSLMRRVQFKNFLRHFATFHYFLEIRLRNYYDKYRAKFIPVDPNKDTLFKDQQAKDPDAFFRESVEGMVQLSLTNHATPILLYLPVAGDLPPNENTSAPLRIKTDLSKKYNVPFVTLWPECVARGKSLYLEADPTHFTAEANVIIGDKLAQAIKPLIK